MVPPILSGFAALVLAAGAAVPTGTARAQARADGQYPVVLFCDKLPFGTGTLRDTFTLAVAGGRATYTRKLTFADAPNAAGASETGSGTVSAGRLVLAARVKGKGFSYEARYAGEIAGQGGLLTGRQDWTYAGKASSRTCQMTVGNGRG